jgi:sugar lactone lactonase YvrE
MSIVNRKTRVWVQCVRLAIGWLLMGLLGCARENVFTFQTSAVPLRVRKPALYPETIEYDAKRGRFLLGSIREGAIYGVNARGKATPVVDDPRLCSVLGMAVDQARDWLWVVNADLGASIKPSLAGPKKVAAVAIYELGTGRSVNYIDLTSLLPGLHLLNGLALDTAGKAYVTDSFSPAIYEVHADGRARVLLQSSEFTGEGINLNGLVVHPDGYLLVVKKSDGSLFRVPLADPSHFSKVSGVQFVAGDGLTLLGKDRLIVIANQVPGVASNRAYSTSSRDGWLSARVNATYSFPNVYPTTSVFRDGALYAVYSELNQLIQASSEQRTRLQLEATILPIGKLQP